MDPLAKKKVEKIQKQQEAEHNFEAVAREWHDKQLDVLAEVTVRDTLSKLINHVFPYIGHLTIGEITAPDVLAVLRRMESEGKISAAHQTKQIVGRVFRYAIASGRATHDPAADLKGALAPENTKHHASITDPKKIGQLLRDIDTYTGTFRVRCALQLAPLLFVRPGELRRAEWKDIDLEAAIWTVPKETMKKAGEERREQLVPLSKQVVAILKELYKVTGNLKRVVNGKRCYIFSARGGWGRLVKQGLAYGPKIYGLLQRGQEGDKSLMGNASFIHVCAHPVEDDRLYIAKKLGVSPDKIPQMPRGKKPPFGFLQWSGGETVAEGHLDFVRPSKLWPKGTPRFRSSDKGRRTLTIGNDGKFRGCHY